MTTTQSRGHPEQRNIASKFENPPTSVLQCSSLERLETEGISQSSDSNKVEEIETSARRKCVSML